MKIQMPRWTEENQSALMEQVDIMMAAVNAWCGQEAQRATAPNALTIDVAQELRILEITPGVDLGARFSWPPGLLRRLDDTLRLLGLEALRRRWSAACSELANDAFGIGLRKWLHSVEEFSSQR